MVIDLHNDRLSVPHQLRDPLDTDRRDLVAEAGAVVMAEGMSSQFPDPEILAVHSRQRIADSFPHFHVAAVGYVDITAAINLQ